MFFCSDNKRLLYYEKLMRQAPGYCPRGGGVYVAYTKDPLDPNCFYDDNSSVKKRILAYNREVAKRKIKPFGRDDIYLDEGHRERFLELLNNKSTGSLMRVSENYLAALFLLTADERLWELSKDHVNGFGINFKDIRISEMNFTRYMMFITAMHIYGSGPELYDWKDAENEEMIPDDVYRIMMVASILEHGGARAFSCSKNVKE